MRVQIGFTFNKLKNHSISRNSTPLKSNYQVFGVILLRRYVDALNVDDEDETGFAALTL
jgi:hypothetical protein